MTGHRPGWWCFRRERIAGPSSPRTERRQNEEGAPRRGRPLACIARRRAPSCRVVGEVEGRGALHVRRLAGHQLDHRLHLVPDLPQPLENRERVGVIEIGRDRTLVGRMGLCDQGLHLDPETLDDVGDRGGQDALLGERLHADVAHQLLLERAHLGSSGGRRGDDASAQRLLAEEAARALTERPNLLVADVEDHRCSFPTRRKSCFTPSYTAGTRPAFLQRRCRRTTAARSGRKPHWYKYLSRRAGASSGRLCCRRATEIA